MDSGDVVGVSFEAQIDPYLSVQLIMLHKCKSIIQLYHHVPGSLSMSDMWGLLFCYFLVL